VLSRSTAFTAPSALIAGSSPVPYAPMTTGAVAVPVAFGASWPEQDVPRWKRTWSPAVRVSALTEASVLKGEAELPLPAVVAEQST
jgi:hypothetical protein